MSSYTETDIINAISDANFLGSGSNSRAYEMPGHELVVLVPHSLQSQSAQVLKLEERKDPFPAHNFGQIVARMGDISICKRQRGLVPQSFGWVHVSVGKKSNPWGEGEIDGFEQKYVFLPQDFDFCSTVSGSVVPVMTPVDQLDPAVLSAEIERRRNEILDAIDTMPVMAYKNALEAMLIIHSNDHQIDPSKPNNILLNPRDQRFGWIDLVDYEKYPEQYPPNIEKVFPLHLPFMLSQGVRQNISIGKRMLDDPDPYNIDLNDREKEVLSTAFLRFVSALEATPSKNWVFDYTNHFSVEELQRRYGFESAAAEQVHARIQKISHSPQSPRAGSYPVPGC